MQTVCFSFLPLNSLWMSGAALREFGQAFDRWGSFMQGRAQRVAPVFSGVHDHATEGGDFWRLKVRMEKDRIMNITRVFSGF